MESIAACQACATGFRQGNLPLVITCGHTFCQECVRKTRVCPFCHSPIVSTASNLLILSISTEDLCSHCPKPLYCPLCFTSLCIDCVSRHSYHGVVAATDPRTVELLEMRIREAKESVQRRNAAVLHRLSEVAEEYRRVAAARDEMVEQVRETFQGLREMLRLRESELLEEVKEAISPIESKLLSISAQLSSTEKSQREEIAALSSLLTCRDFSSLQSFCPSAPAEVPSSGRVTDLPSLSLDPAEAQRAILSLGKVSAACRHWLFAL